MVKLTFKSKEEIQDGVYRFDFEPVGGFSWQPGQYMHYFLKHPNPDDRGEERWFTISSAPFEGHISLTTRWSGDKASSFKKAMFALKPGEQLEAEGPDGKFVWQEGDYKHVLVSGGIGITPFRSMLLQLDHDNKPINADLLYANRDDHFVFDDLLNKLSGKYPDLRVKKFIGKEITIEDLKRYIAPNTVFYLSGPKSMVVDFTDELIAAGVDDERILKDRFPGYANMANA